MYKRKEVPGATGPFVRGLTFHPLAQRASLNVPAEGARRPLNGRPLREPKPLLSGRAPNSTLLTPHSTLIKKPSPRGEGRAHFGPTVFYPAVGERLVYCSIRLYRKQLGNPLAVPPLPFRDRRRLKASLL